MVENNKREKVIELIKHKDTLALNAYLEDNSKDIDFDAGNGKVDEDLYFIAIEHDHLAALNVLFQHDIVPQKETDLIFHLYYRDCLVQHVLKYLLEEGFILKQYHIAVFILDGRDQLLDYIFNELGKEIFCAEFSINLKSVTVMKDGNDPGQEDEDQEDFLPPPAVQEKIKEQYKITRYYTPLIFACEKENMSLVRNLVDYGAEVNEYNLDYTPLIVACEKGNEEMVKYLLEKGADPNRRASKDGEYNPLIMACKMGNMSLVRYLVEEKGVNVNVETLFYTPLMMACEEQQVAITKYLVEEKGADTQKEINNVTPLIMACLKENADLSLVKCLVEHGADVNHEVANNRTPLITACRSGNQEIVEYLLDKGANVNGVSGGHTALMTACQKCFLPLVACLVEHGADVNQDSLYYDPPLTMVCELGFCDIVRYLVEHGADVNRKNRSDMTTPLIMACSHEGDNYQEIVEYLVSNQGEINRETKTSSPLIMACTNGNKALVEWLVEHGAEVNKKSSQGVSPLEKAKDSASITRYLLDHGAQPIPESS